MLSQFYSEAQTMIGKEDLEDILATLCNFMKINLTSYLEYIAKHCPTGGLSGDHAYPDKVLASCDTLFIGHRRSIMVAFEQEEFTRDTLRLEVMLYLRAAFVDGVLSFKDPPKDPDNFEEPYIRLIDDLLINPFRMFGKLKDL